MFTNLTYAGVKNTSASLELKNLTVLTGPNDSGKSAAAIAFRLAVTGKDEVGASAASQLKLLGGTNALAAANGLAMEATWALRNGKKTHSCEESIQGKCPVSVDEFWNLTGEERLKLLASEGAIASIEVDIAVLEGKLKQLKTIIDAPAPVMPEPYTGKPHSVLQDELEAANSRIRTHRDALNNKKDLERLAKIPEEIAKDKADLVTAEAELASLEHKAQCISDQLAIYREDQAKEPKIIASARARGVSYKQAIRDTGSLLVDAIDFIEILRPDSCGDYWSGSLRLDIDEATQFLCDEPAAPSPLSMWDGMPIERALTHTHIYLEEAKTKHKGIQGNIAYLESVLTNPTKELSGLLSDEEFFSLIQESEKIQGDIRLAMEWATHGQQAKRIMDQRVKAQDDFDKYNEELKAAKAAMAQKINELKQPIQDRANELLSAAGATHLSLDIVKTGKNWALSVDASGIALEAMARNKRLLYGLCLLTAIQEASNARSPILVAECAEMDQVTFDNTIRAMKLRQKGNVILEHWHKPSVECHLIEMGK